MTPAQMEQFARDRAAALFDRGEIDRIPEFVTDDFINHEAWEGEDPGHDGFRIRMERLHAAFSELRLEVHEVVANGDLVAYRATLHGVHTGPLLGLAATGRRVSSRHMHMLRLRDGRSSEHWAVRDDLGLMQQLGVIPPLG